MNSSLSSYSISKIENDIYLIPKSKYTHTLIWLHGLGDSPQSYLDFFTSDEIVPKTTKIILLSAPYSSVTCFNNEKTTSWFDIYKMNFGNEKDYSFEDVQKNSLRIYDIIEKESIALNNNYKNIFIGGFSQGAMLSLYIGLNYKKEIGGIISCSGILFPQVEIINKDINIFIGHGKDDNMINIDVALKCYERILNFKNVTIKKYNFLPHSINAVELSDIKEFFKKNMI
jgi:phospholipase/carboxylesterase